MNPSCAIRNAVVLAALVLIPITSVRADITWNFIFEDVSNNTNVGFDDPTHGATRRATAQAVTEYLNTVLNHNGTVDMRFNNSQTDGSGFLASAGPLWQGGSPKFQNGAVFVHATTGNDPFGSAPDGQITFDFGYNWNNGIGSAGNNEYDLFTVMLHEITHTMGFLSLVDAQGVSRLDGNNPGLFANYDRFLERGDGTKLFSDEGGAKFEGTPADLVSGDVFFNGANANAGNGGNRIKIYAPGSFASGSSIGHVDPSNGNWVMRHNIGTGVERRAYSDGEIGILKDIGWSTVPEPGQIVGLSIIAITMWGGGYWRRRRRKVSQSS